MNNKLNANPQQRPGGVRILLLWPGESTLFSYMKEFHLQPTLHPNMWLNILCLLWNDGVGERENLPAAPRTRTRTRTNTNSLRGLWRSGPVSSSSKPRSSHCTRRRGTIPAFMFHTYTHTENPMFTITGQEWKGATSCGRPEQVTQQVESFFVFKGLLVFFWCFFFF